MEPPRQHSFSLGLPPRSLMLVVRVVAVVGLVLIAIEYFSSRGVDAEHARTEKLREAAGAVLPNEGQEERDARNRQRLLTRYEGALRDSHNNTPIAETEGYHKLLDTLAQTPPEELAARSIGHLDHTRALQSPDDLRGETVEVRGLLADLWAYKLARPYLNGRDVWRGLILKADGSEPVLVDFADTPPQVRLQRDPVDVIGVFYRTVTYETKRGNEVEVPYVIARNLSLVDTSPRGFGGWMERNSTWILLVSVGAAFAFGLWLSNAGRRGRGGPPNQTIGFREMFERRTSPPETDRT
jgi:hypothetical protein